MHSVHSNMQKMQKMVDTRLKNVTLFANTYLTPNSSNVTPGSQCSNGKEVIPHVREPAWFRVQRHGQLHSR
jgi:hypothetical protein